MRMPESINENQEDWMPLCPNCGERSSFIEHSGSFTETHGLDCGPYETWTESWLVCARCGGKTDEREVAAANRRTGQNSEYSRV